MDGWSGLVYLKYSEHLPCALQVESGFFLDCDVKVVGKSIRDRVALIKWRRERTVSSGNGEAPVKKTHQNLLQVPGSGVPQAATLRMTDCEDQEVEQQTLTCTVPTTLSNTCKKLQLDADSVWYTTNPQFIVINVNIFMNHNYEIITLTMN